MDGQRFDRWARTFAAAASRRGLIKGLAGTLVAGLVGANLEDVAAAARCHGCGPCQRCRNGTCVPRRDGTLCGQCGKCAGGVCVANPARCGSCKTCNASTFACEALECGECGQCEGRVCRPNPAREGSDCGGSTCQVCANGQCVAKPENTECPGGKCCGGTCRANAACCDDDGCPECGKCENFRCDRTARNGQSCGNAPTCNQCQNGECVARSDGASCVGANGTCCSGFCCIGNQICCSGECCAGQCAFGCCLGGSSASATGANLCCPFGPPCGEGSNARCCDEDQECCEGECKPLGECCPEESVCGDQCCDQGETCCDGTCCDGPCNDAGNACCPSLRSCGDACCDDGTECCGGQCCGDGELCCGEVCCSTTCTGPGLSVCCPDQFFCVGSPYPDPNQHTYICCDSESPVCCVADGFCHPPGWVCQD